MRKSVIRFILCSVLLLAALGGLVGGAVLAEDATPTQGTLDVTAQYPIVKGKPTYTFTYDVMIYWNSISAKNFNLSMTVPSGWSSVITRSSPPSEVAAIRMEANQGDVPQSITVSMYTSYTQQPKPGEYVATLNVVSDDGAIKKSIDLKAVVTATYSYTMRTPSGGLYMEALADKDNAIVVQVYNNGTEEMKNIGFEAIYPEGWDVVFQPGGVAALKPGETQNILVNVRPPKETIAGDYVVNLSSLSVEYEPLPLNLRVAVVATSIWRWVTIGVVAVAIIGLGILFWRISKRQTD